MKHALLIIDVQQALCSGAEAAFDIDRVGDRINSVSAKARVAGLNEAYAEGDRTANSISQRAWRFGSSFPLIVAHASGSPQP